MYNLFKNSLLSPKSIVQKRTLDFSKVIIYLLLLVMLIILPIASNEIVNRTTMKTINHQIIDALETEKIDFEIVNGELTSGLSSEEFLVIKNVLNNVELVFAPDEEVFKNQTSSSDQNMMRILFTKYEVKYQFLGEVFKSYTYADIGVSKLDFSKISQSYSNEFVNNFVKITNEFYDDNKVSIILIVIISNAVVTAINLLISVLFVAGIIFFINNKTTYKFYELFVMGTLALTPLAIFYTFGYILSNSLLILMGNIIYIIYFTYITKQKTRGENHEL